MGLTPFFKYYGGKWRDAVKNYPPPDYTTIVEPFSGAAGYSMRYPGNRVILCDLDPIIIGVWKYLQRVKPDEVLNLPDVPEGGTVDDLKVSQEAKWLIGFWLNAGVASPCKRPSKWMVSQVRPGSYWGTRARNAIASQVEYIRHWKVYQCSYLDCPFNGKATWFVDPPYQAAGRHYKFGASNIDYEHLGSWCRSRPGQVIVCENEGATWLPFKHLATVKTTRRTSKSKEAIWLQGFEGPLDELV